MGPSLWILNHYAQPPDVPGGTRHYELGRQLVKHAYDVTLFASSFRHSERRESHAYGQGGYQIERIDGLRFVWLKTFPYLGNDWRRLANMASYLVRSCYWGPRLARPGGPVPKPDTVLGSSVHLLAVLSAYLLARHFKAHFVMEVRDLWPQTLIEMGALSEGSLVARLLRGLERFLYRRAEKIIVLLPKAEDYITGLGIDPEKVVWIPNGVNLSEYPGISRSTSADQPFTVMYVGAHGRVNALEGLLEAARQVQARGYADIQFILIGDGPEKKNLMGIARELGLDNTTFQDPLPKREVAGTLEDADTLVHLLPDLSLYRYGISPNKWFDYLGAGRPVVLAGNPANNLIRDAGCGVSVPPEDSAALADAIIRLYEMPAEQREAMGRQGRALVEQQYDYTLLAGQLMDLLGSLQ